MASYTYHVRIDDYWGAGWVETCRLVSVVLIDCSRPCSGLDVSRLLLELTQANIHRIMNVAGHLDEEGCHLVDVLFQFLQGLDRAQQDVVDCFLYQSLL